MPIHIFFCRFSEYDTRVQPPRIDRFFRQSPGSRSYTHCRQSRLVFRRPRTVECTAVPPRFQHRLDPMVAGGPQYLLHQQRLLVVLRPGEMHTGRQRWRRPSESCRFLDTAAEPRPVGSHISRRKGQRRKSVHTIQMGRGQDHCRSQSHAHRHSTVARRNGPSLAQRATLPIQNGQQCCA